MNRRGFLRFLGAASAIALDPERALWVPGAKLISIPAPRVLHASMTLDLHFHADAFVLEWITRDEFKRRYAVEPPLPAEPTGKLELWARVRPQVVLA